MSPTKKYARDEKVETAAPIYHLVHPTAEGKPLCGEDSPSAMIGSYVEHLDTTGVENLRWLREIFGSDGKAVTPCGLCLSLYQPVLIDIVPFDLVCNIHFKPDESIRGYDVTSSAFAILGDIRKEIKAHAGIGFIAARCLGGLEFIVNVNASAVVVHVESANRGKKVQP